MRLNWITCGAGPCRSPPTSLRTGIFRPRGWLPRWTSESRPLIDRPKPATMHVVPRRDFQFAVSYGRTRSSTILASSASVTTDASIKSQDMPFLVTT